MDGTGQFVCKLARLTVILPLLSTGRLCPDGYTQLSPGILGPQGGVALDDHVAL